MPNKYVLFQPKAKVDLELIYAYTESSWGIEQAEKYVDRLYHAMDQLLIYPEIGVIYVSAKNEYLKIVVDRHIIYYRNLNENILIVRILHSKMNRDNWLK